jgi:hypothetical protein
LTVEASRKEPDEPLSSSTVEASSKLSEVFANSAEVVVACACGGVRSLLIIDGESRATEVSRVVPLLVVDGHIGLSHHEVYP